MHAMVKILDSEEKKAFSRGVDRVMTFWDLRWHLANLLCRLAFWIAPRGPSRDLLIGAFKKSGEEIMGTVQKSRRDRTIH